MATTTDALGGETTFTSAASSAIANVDDPTQVISGTSGSGTEGTHAITGILSVTDEDGLTDGSYFSLHANPSNGTASIDSISGAWSYTPTANFNGNDSFVVTITDDAGYTATQIISINVVPDTIPIFTTNQQLLTQGSAVINAADGAQYISDLTELRAIDQKVTGSVQISTDSAVTISDVISQLRHIVGLTELSGFEKAAADNDGNGDITISDVISSLRIIVGLTDAPDARIVDENGNSEFIFDSRITELYVVAPGDSDLSWSLPELL
ncbi:hypothetical protein XMA152_002432 [Marinobacterium sp. xm-a-152]|nr:hypothetical protein [Marinobacterium sp. xm-a-152]